MNIRRFEAVMRRELDRIPDRYKVGVTGFFVQPRAHRQSGSLLGVYVLGHYHTDNRGLGPTVTLYYGSFRKVFRGAADKVWRREIARTLAHELLHHWELRSGIDDLGEEDRAKIRHWKRRLGHPTGEPTGRDFLEAIGFLAIVFGLMFTASWLFLPH